MRKGITPTFVLYRLASNGVLIDLIRGEDS
jgi:hypothetical protein